MRKVVLLICVVTPISSHCVLSEVADDLRLLLHLDLDFEESFVLLHLSADDLPQKVCIELLASLLINRFSIRDSWD